MDAVAYLVVCTVALVVSGLSFFTGFGLGTLLMPAFALFFPIEVAVALTGVVHLLNGLFKLALVARHVDFGVLLRFGLPAVLAAQVGARLLLWLSDLAPLYTYRVGGRELDVMPLELAIAGLMVAFAAFEIVPRLRSIAIAPRWLPLGGALSGFFGGLSGHQGALRSPFLLRVGLSKEAFVATGAAIAALVDVSRLSVYARHVLAIELQQHGSLLVAATAAAFAGAMVGNRLLKKVSLRGLELVVAALLVVVAIGLATGLL